MKRSLSVRISSEEGCNLLSLDRETFIRILGSINEHLKKNYDWLPHHLIFIII